MSFGALVVLYNALLYFEALIEALYGWFRDALLNRPVVAFFLTFAVVFGVITVLIGAAYLVNRLN